MQILLLHSEDDVLAGLLNTGPWDAIFDLGASCDRFEQSLSSTVQSVAKPQFDDLCGIKRALAPGVERIVDNAGFDWWNLLSVEFYEPMLELLRMQRFIQTVPQSATFFVTRAGLHARLLNALCPGRVRVLSRSPSRRFRDKASRALRLRPHQMLQVLADKYDANYKIRRWASQLPKPSRVPVVLLPSAYSNASRAALSYAELLPDSQFLLVATRRSGSVSELPTNVSCASLAAFARGTYDPNEFQHLLGAWHTLTRTFNGELSLLARAGCFDSVPSRIRHGLAMRNAWEGVFDSQPIASVLCADEMNWHTGLPLLIARSRNIPAIACNHGALDLRYAFRATNADRLIAKGLMEWDYLVNSCKAHEETIEIAAPSQSCTMQAGPRGDSIIFFSEPYEAFGERCLSYYGQILPPLAKLAQRNDCELVLKLHPFESRRERTRLVSNLLPEEPGRVVRIVDGPLEQELLGRAWFGITVTSSTVIDCALNKVPAFSCRWLDSSPTGYGEQFVRFGAAKGLSSADEIEKIPEMLRNFILPDLQSLWHTVDPERLQELLGGTAVSSPIYQAPTTERVWA